MALYHKWDVKNDFAFELQFFSLIFDNLGGWHNTQQAYLQYNRVAFGILICRAIGRGEGEG
jgi:hypothetical protein